jgi:hypothetical protein
MFSKKLLLVFSMVALGFTACPAPPPPPILLGTITAPAGSDVKGTIIMACNITQCTPQRSATAEVFTIDNTGLTSEWSLRVFGSGKYQVIAVNTSQGLIGVYKNPTTNSSVVEVDGYGGMASNINITLVKGAVPAQALELFKTELPTP